MAPLVTKEFMLTVVAFIIAVPFVVITVVALTIVLGSKEIAVSLVCGFIVCTLVYIRRDFLKKKFCNSSKRPVGDVEDCLVYQQFPRLVSAEES